jgi:two-component system, OmpR family, sensor histidine kinase BaeS
MPGGADAARDRVHGGSGIGLTIAKTLVEAQDGTIAAASPGRGRGSIFTVRLPAS